MKNFNSFKIDTIIFFPFNSGQAEIIINILIDVSGFLAYENRELQLIEVQEEAEV